MQRLLATVVATLFAASASAQTRDDWIGKCQAEDSELSNSNGFRVCTELYVVHLEEQQARLLAALLGLLGPGAGANDIEPSGREHFIKSQEMWRTYAEEHCRVLQAVAGDDGPVGDAFPSCSADAFEARNDQLTQLLETVRER